MTIETNENIEINIENKPRSVEELINLKIPYSEMTDSEIESIIDYKVENIVYKKDHNLIMNSILEHNKKSAENNIKIANKSYDFMVALIDKSNKESNKESNK